MLPFKFRWKSARPGIQAPADRDTVAAPSLNQSCQWPGTLPGVTVLATVNGPGVNPQPGVTACWHESESNSGQDHAVASLRLETVTVARATRENRRHGAVTVRCKISLGSVCLRVCRLNLN